MNAIKIKEKTYQISIESLRQEMRRTEAEIRSQKSETRKSHTGQTRSVQSGLMWNKEWATFLYCLRAGLRGRQHCQMTPEKLERFLEKWMGRESVSRAGLLELDKTTLIDALQEAADALAKWDLVYSVPSEKAAKAKGSAALARAHAALKGESYDHPVSTNGLSRTETDRGERMEKVSSEAPRPANLLSRLVSAIRGPDSQGLERKAG